MVILITASSHKICYHEGKVQKGVRTVAESKEWKAGRNYMLQWIPMICRQVLKEDISFKELGDFIKGARHDLHNEMEVFYRSMRIYSGMQLSREEKNALEVAGLLRDKELVRCHKALKFMEKYLKNGKKTCILDAQRLYEESEFSWRQLITHMIRSVLLELEGKRFRSEF